MTRRSCTSSGSESHSTMSRRLHAARPHYKRRRSIAQPPRSGLGFVQSTLDSLEALPEAQNLISEVQARRRAARPGYSARSMMRACVLRYLLGERFVVGFIERLESSERLRELCGFDGSVPSEATFSRFFKLMTDYTADVETLTVRMVERLRQQLPDLGRVVAVDSTDIESYASPYREVPSDPDANWGYRTRKTKNRRKRSDADRDDKEPFYGYKLHALIDVVYGVPLVMILRPASDNDSPLLRTLVEKAEEMYHWWAPEYLVADRGYDAQANHRFCYDRGIKPVIHIRKPINTPLHDGIYSRLGIPVCGKKTKMNYVWTDPATGEHIYRCPPEGCEFKARSSGAVMYCNTREHRENPLDNLRVISVVARASAEWKRIYRLRQVIERYFGSAKQSRLLNGSRYLSRDKVLLNSTLSMLTYLATMLARLESGDPGRIRHMRIRGIR